MRISSLSLEHFRNYSSQTVEMGNADIQLFVGPNGSGKTNLIEAISILSLLKSCRGRDDDEMVQWDRAFYRIKANTVSDSGEQRLMEVVCETSPRKKKAVFVNDVRSTSAGVIGLLPTVTFLPQDLLLFSGPPAERRRFLDQLLCQVSSEYFSALSHYQKVLQQRNALLKRIAQQQEPVVSLEIWDREVSNKGAFVTLSRLELIEMLNVSLREQMRELGEDWHDVVLRYERKTTARALQDIEREMREILLHNRDRDILMQSTSSGPHREDWQAYRDDRMLPSFASRGQERVAVLALLLLEVSYVELRRGEKPVILLDDAFSELDDHHQGVLLEAFRGYQVIMTTTRVPPKAEGATIHGVFQGRVSEELVA